LLREAIAQSGRVDAVRYQLIFAPDNWAMRRIARRAMPGSISSSASTALISIWLKA